MMQLLARRIMHRRGDFILALLFFLFSLVVYFYLIPSTIRTPRATGFTGHSLYQNSRLIPIIWNYFVMVSSFGLFLNVLFNRSQDERIANGSFQEKVTFNFSFNILIAFLSLIGFVYFLPRIGFLFTSMLVLFLFMLSFGYRNLYIIFLLSISVPFLIKEIFYRLFQVILP